MPHIDYQNDTILASPLFSATLLNSSSIASTRCFASRATADYNHIHHALYTVTYANIYPLYFPGYRRTPTWLSIPARHVPRRDNRRGRGRGAARPISPCRRRWWPPLGHSVVQPFYVLDFSHPKLEPESESYP